MKAPPCRFSIDDANRAYDEWGANCGPGAIAAIIGKALDEIRPHLGDFETKGYTNPTLMWSALQSLGVKFRIQNRSPSLPVHGLARIQWEGPWTNPGVPIRARYRHTHWIAAVRDTRPEDTPGWEEPLVFDINAMCVGGWIPFSQWNGSLVPWLLKQCEPKASGVWHITHSVEIG